MQRGARSRRCGEGRGGEDAERGEEENRGRGAEESREKWREKRQSNDQVLLAVTNVLKTLV